MCPLRYVQLPCVSRTVWFKRCLSLSSLCYVKTDFLYKRVLFQLQVNFLPVLIKCPEPPFPTTRCDPSERCSTNWHMTAVDYRGNMWQHVTPDLRLITLCRHPPTSLVYLHNSASCRGSETEYPCAMKDTCVVEDNDHFLLQCCMLLTGGDGYPSSS